MPGRGICTQMRPTSSQNHLLTWNQKLTLHHCRRVGPREIPSEVLVHIAGLGFGLDLDLEGFLLAEIVVC